MKSLEILSKKNMLIFSFLILCFILFLSSLLESNKLMFGPIIGKYYYFYFCILCFSFIISLFIIINKSPFIVKICIEDFLLITFYLYIVIYILATDKNKFYSEEFKFQSFLLIFYFFVKEFWRLINNTKDNTLIMIILLLFQMSVISQSFIGLFQQFGIVKSNNQFFAITGSFTNPAPFSFYLAVSFPFSLGFLLFNSNNKNQSRILKESLFICSLINIVLIVVLLLLTQIRTSWLMIIISSILIIYYKYKNKLNSILNLKKYLLIILLIISVGVFLLYKIYLIKENSAKGRMLIWKITTEKIIEKPIIGQGYDSFKEKYNYWQGKWFERHSDLKDKEEGSLAGLVYISYNTFLKISVETGLISAIIFFTFVILSIFKSFWNRKNNWLYYLFSVSALTILLGSLISYTLKVAHITILFYMMLAILNSQAEYRKFSVSVPFPRDFYVRLISFLVFITFINSLMLNTINKYKALKTWKKAYTYSRYDHNKFVLIKMKEIYPYLKHNGMYLQQYGINLNHAGLFLESNEMLKEALKYRHDPYIYICMGKNYEFNLNFNKARESYLFASNLNPSMFYPHYLLAKLFFINGKIVESKEIALKLLNKKVKIKNKDIEKMKDEMKKILEY